MTHEHDYRTADPSHIEAAVRDTDVRSVETVCKYLAKRNEENPSRENALALTNAQQAAHWVLIDAISRSEQAEAEAKQEAASKEEPKTEEKPAPKPRRRRVTKAKTEPVKKRARRT